MDANRVILTENTILISFNFILVILSWRRPCYWKDYRIGTPAEFCRRKHLCLLIACLLGVGLCFFALNKWNIVIVLKDYIGLR